MNPNSNNEKEPQFTVFGSRIKAIRNAVELSQKDFSSAIGVSQATISFYENGAVGPNLSTIQKIVDKYPRINPLYLLGEVNEMYGDESDNTNLIQTLLQMNEGIDADTPLETENTSLSKDTFDRIMLFLKDPSNKPKTKKQENAEVVLENELLKYRIIEKDIQITYLSTLVENLRQQNEDLRKIAKLS